MDSISAGGPGLSVHDGMPIIALTMDQSDRLCALISPQLWDWRPADPSGRWCFGLGELAMHIADARWLFAGQLDGADHSEHNWILEQRMHDGEAWRFRVPPSTGAVLDSLAQSRAALQHWLAQPLAQLFSPTPGTEAYYIEYQQRLREQGQEQAALDYARRGPATVARTFASFVAHESGHRGSLQTLLRLHGINTGSE